MSQKVKWRKYNSIPVNTKPLIVGWVPSKSKLYCDAEELPGYWLYSLQVKHLPGKLGKFYGWLFGVFYADKPIKRK